MAQARADKRQGKAPSTQAGEFIKEEMDHIREGVHGARSTKQAIAIGLSKARRAGVELPPPKAGKTSAATRTHSSAVILPLSDCDRSGFGEHGHRSFLP